MAPQVSPIVFGIVVPPCTIYLYIFFADKKNESISDSLGSRPMTQ